MGFGVAGCYGNALRLQPPSMRHMVCAVKMLAFNDSRPGTCSSHGGVHWWTGNLGAGWTRSALDEH